MSDQPWTIDSLAHALPHPDQRQQFWRDVNLTPVDQLPDTIARWQQHVERLQEALAHAERLRGCTEHGDGQLPPEYRETPQSQAAWEQWEQQMRQQQGHNAA
ncbi:hypothetical protein ACTWQF_19200 [Streptomyces sp. 8N114]|uniref:hypothetical protein n=1 Tax=Streptomyces sp. 8N114 TaxID=3457419 RepID=UPI003FD6757C